MNEVQVMTEMGTRMGKALGTGLHAARVNAIRAGQVGIDKATQAVGLAEQKLSDHGVSPNQIQETLTDNAEAAKAEVAKVTRKTRKKLAKQARLASKELGKHTAKAGKRAKRAAKDFADLMEPAARRRRRWPWAVGLLAVAAGATFVVLSRRPREVHFDEEAAPEASVAMDKETRKNSDN